jgi:hypothetical protein
MLYISEFGQDQYLTATTQTVETLPQSSIESLRSRLQQQSREAVTAPSPETVVRTHKACPTGYYWDDVERMCRPTGQTTPAQEATTIVSPLAAKEAQILTPTITQNPEQRAESVAARAALVEQPKLVQPMTAFPVATRPAPTFPATAPIYAAARPKQQSILKITLPFVAAVVGIPLALWLVERQRA